MQAVKCVRQNYCRNDTIAALLDAFRHMVNDCIRIGLENDVLSLKRLSVMSYKQLAKYNIPSYYKYCAISRAAGILAARKKSIRRGCKTRSPYAVKPMLVSYLGFKIINNKILIPLGARRYFDISLNKHSQQILCSDSTLIVRSFTLTADIVSIIYSKEVNEIQVAQAAGVDRNLRNLTYGNCDKITQYDLSKSVEFAETTKDVIRSFKRNDVRIRKKLASKYGTRRRNRINQMLHRVSKNVVRQAVGNKEAIVFEDIRRIRRLYQKGNGQGSNYRGIMNSWPFHEIKRQIEYKAKWSGIPVIRLSAKETRNTSSLCPRCGERLQVGQKKRFLWCSKCNRVTDRDVIAVMNLSLKGLARFASSKGIAGEAMRGNVAQQGEPLILRVDAMNSLSELIS